MKKILLTISSVFTMLIAFSQAPNLFNYQGVARNAVGNVLPNQSISLRLTIRNGSATGSSVYSETRNMLTNAFGLFNVVVGSPGATGTSGTITGINWASGSKFLQVEIDPAGGNNYTSAGTTQLVSVPYAMNAAGAAPIGAAGGDLAGSTYPNPVIAPLIVTTGKLADNAVTTNKITDLNVTTSKLADAAVTTVKLADNAVTTNKITDLNVTTPKLADAAVTTVKLAAGAVTSDKLTYPLIVTQAETASALLDMTNSSVTGTSGAIRGTTASQDGNAIAVTGQVSSTSPGGFSSAVRGINNGTGGLGIGVYGSQAGNGWGVYGTTPAGLGVYGNSNSGFGVYGLSNSGLGVYGTSSTGEAGRFEITNNTNTTNALSGITNSSGIGLVGTNTGTGNAAFFRINNSSNTNIAANVVTNGVGGGLFVQLSNASNGSRGIDVLHTGVGSGVFATSVGGSGVWGITSSISAAGILGDNTLGEAVVGRNRGGVGVGAVVGRNDDAGYGVRGFNTKNGIGVLGQAGISGGTGVGGRFENVNSANISTALEVATNGVGGGLFVQLSNASNGARGIDVLQTGVGPGVFATSVGGNGVWGITSSISAAGVIGDNTLGEAVVGRNRGGVGVGAVVGRNDDAGYGVRGFNTKNGIGVLGQAGISGGTGVGGRFENVNAANTNNVVEISGNGSGNLLVLKNPATNLARIDATGKGFFNGGTQNSGADIAEMFDIQGERAMYEPGDVLMISVDKDRTIEKSSGAYSALVVGVYATKPGVTLTEEFIDADLDNKIPMGVIGVIPTKVCLEGGVIKRGDMLVTSSIPGVAMKADLEKAKTGQVIGKALQNFSSNHIDKIKVLVSIK